ncbi:hypothetical protein BASA81_004058 [Batrachochytrium salamandrivorans]|nr:hypothetical protein BASA81_004058 [Batrachochytrium salamandrivorans]
MADKDRDDDEVEDDEDWLLDPDAPLFASGAMAAATTTTTTTQEEELPKFLPPPPLPQAERFDVGFDEPKRKRQVLWSPALTSTATQTANYHTMYTHQTNLAAYPRFEFFTPTHHPANTTRHVVLGDLHGNALKLLYVLIVEGVLDLEVAEFGTSTGGEMARKHELYGKLRQLISVPNAPVEVMREFRKLVTDHTKLCCDKAIVVHFLGDEFADRGQNDYFTVVLLARLADLPNWEILLSNHGCIFYKYCVGWMEELDNGDTESASPLTHQVIAGITGNAMERATNSLHEFHKTVPKLLYEEKVVLAKEIVKIIKRLSPMSSITTERTLVVLTHAPVNLDSIRQVYKTCLGVEPTRHTHVELSIAEIQNEFRTKFAGKVSQYSGTGPHSKIELTFNRVIFPRLDSLEMRPIAGMAFVHAHDGKVSRQTDYGYCLDNTLGKDLAWTELDDYVVLVMFAN